MFVLIKEIIPFWAKLGGADDGGDGSGDDEREDEEEECGDDTEYGDEVVVAGLERTTTQEVSRFLLEKGFDGTDPFLIRKVSLACQNAYSKLHHSQMTLDVRMAVLVFAPQEAVLLRNRSLLSPVLGKQYFERTPLSYEKSASACLEYTEYLQLIEGGYHYCCVNGELSSSLVKRNLPLAKVCMTHNSTLR